MATALVETPKDERHSNSIQVCLERTPAFYARIGRRMLHGSPESNKPTFDEVVVTGLGTATKIAVGAASLMEKDQQAFIKKIETSFFASSRGPRRLPKITVTLLKNPNAPAMEQPQQPQQQQPQQQQQKESP